MTSIYRGGSGIALIFAGSVAAQQPPEVECRTARLLRQGGRDVRRVRAAEKLSIADPAGEMWVTDKSLPDFNWSADRH